MPKSPLLLTFKETSFFTRHVTEYMTDDELRALQNALLECPEAGDVIPRSGGLRKLRWRAQGRGKRSGYRVIYFPQLARDMIWLLTIYPKNLVENIPEKVLREIRNEVENG